MTDLVSAGVELLRAGWRSGLEEHLSSNIASLGCMEGVVNNRRDLVVSNKAKGEDQYPRLSSDLHVCQGAHMPALTFRNALTHFSQTPKRGVSLYVF